MRPSKSAARSRAGAWRGVALGVRGVAQGTPCGAMKGHGMWLRWGAAWDSEGARHAVARGAQYGAAQGRSMWLRMGATWSWAGGQRRIEQGRSVGLRRGAA